MGKRRVKPFIDAAGADTRHYRLVHRSQRDPLAADENASRMVLQAVPREIRSANRLRGQRVWHGDGDEEPDAAVFDPAAGADRAYLEGDAPDYDDASDDEAWLDGEAGSDDEEAWETDEDAQSGDDEHAVGESGKEPEAPTKSAKGKEKALDNAAISDAAATEPDDSRIGQAALYGVFLDDRNYDYTKHLKPIGQHNDAVFIPAKSAVEAPKRGGALEFKAAPSAEDGRRVRFELPSEVLPSEREEEIGLLNRAAENKNLLLEVDPDVREVLYALDDEEYVDDEVEDDFFGMLDSENVPETFKSQKDTSATEGGDADGEWAEVERFKRSAAAGRTKAAENPEDEDDEDYSDDRYSSDGRDDGLSKFSMTSSALFRNKHMTLLDDRFDRMLKDEYDTEDDDADDLDDGDEGWSRGNAPNESEGQRAVQAAPGEVIWTKEQMMEHVLSQFLDETLLQGRSLVPSDDPIEEVEEIRRGLREALRQGDFSLVADGPVAKDVVYDSDDGEEEEDRRWDVETILTTYSNIYNRPALLGGSRRRQEQGAEKIVLGPDGIPLSWAEKRREELRKRDAKHALDSAAPAAEPELEVPKVNKGAARVKGESKEEKKARKEAVKEERRRAREDKKELKAAYATEKGKLSRSSKMRDAEKNRIHID